MRSPRKSRVGFSPLRCASLALREDDELSESESESEELSGSRDSGLYGSPVRESSKVAGWFLRLHASQWSVRNSCRAPPISLMMSSGRALMALVKSDVQAAEVNLEEARPLTSSPSLRKVSS